MPKSGDDRTFQRAKEQLGFQTHARGAGWGSRREAVPRTSRLAELVQLHATLPREGLAPVTEEDQQGLKLLLELRRTSEADEFEMRWQEAKLERYRANTVHTNVRRYVTLVLAVAALFQLESAEPLSHLLSHLIGPWERLAVR